MKYGETEHRRDAVRRAERFEATSSGNADSRVNEARRNDGVRFAWLPIDGSREAYLFAWLAFVLFVEAIIIIRELL